MSKPELGRVIVGDRLLVIPATYGRGTREPVEALVIKAGRVWIDLEEINQAPSFRRKWRLRLDTQDSGSGDRFVTAEQYAWEQRIHAANAYLNEVGIRPDRGSPWYDPERQITLANLLRQHDGQPEL